MRPMVIPALRSLNVSCPIIVRFTLDFTNICDRQIVGLCKFYGPSLQELQVEVHNDGMGKAEFGKPFESCPNIRIQAPREPRYRMTVNGFSTDVALLLGPATVAWSFEGCEVNQSTSFARIGWACPNLQRCLLVLEYRDTHSVSQMSFKGLFSLPKPVVI